MNMNSTKRRDFICSMGTMVLMPSVLAEVRTPGCSAAPLVRFGMVADLHYADKEPMEEETSTRYYRESLPKLEEAVSAFNAHRLDFAIELGDFKDLTNGRDETLAALDRIEAAFAKFNGARYHVPGNHDFDCLTEDDFFSRTPNSGQGCGNGYYSFACNSVKFIVLDGCYTSGMKHYSAKTPWTWTDSNIPSEEMEWLKRELATANGHVVVFCHQRLDLSAEPRHLVKNAAEVRSILEKSGNVRAVVTGHQHTGGQSVVNGIPYYTLAAMVTGMGPNANCYAEAALYPSGDFTVTGFFRAESYKGLGFPVRANDMS